MSEIMSKSTRNEIGAMIGKIFDVFPGRSGNLQREDAARAYVGHFAETAIEQGLTVRHLERCLRRCRLSGESFIPAIGVLLDWCYPTVEELGIVPASKAIQMSKDQIDDLGEQNPLAAQVIVASNRDAEISRLKFCTSERQADSIRADFCREYLANIERARKGQRLPGCPTWTKRSQRIERKDRDDVPSIEAIELAQRLVDTIDPAILAEGRGERFDQVRFDWVTSQLSKAHSGEFDAVFADHQRGSLHWINQAHQISAAIYQILDRYDRRSDGEKLAARMKAIKCAARKMSDLADLFVGGSK